MSDTSDLDRLITDLSNAGVVAAVKARRAVRESAERIETMARDFAPKRRLPHYARTITTDLSDGGLTAEVGPDPKVNGQANLAPIFEYGTSSLAPRAHMGPALDRESPGFLASIRRLGGDVL